MTEQIQSGQPRMTRDMFTSLYGALNKLEDLRKTPVESTIVNIHGEAHNKQRADDIEGLVKYLAEYLILHGPELLSCWACVRDEYEPLVSIMTSVSRRVQTNLDRAPLK